MTDAITTKLAQRFGPGVAVWTAGLTAARRPAPLPMLREGGQVRAVAELLALAR
ncbi:MAG TPA: hypothetical protein VF892_18340 [Pseudonocardiaceae bacterium]